MDDIRLQVAASRRILFRAGLDAHDIAGQVTARTPGEDAVWTTPLELFDETLPHHVVKVPFGATGAKRSLVEVPGGALPVSSASAWVEAIYRARPDVGCVIHTHAPHIVAVSSTGDVVGLYSNRSVIFHGEQAFYDEGGENTDSPEHIVAALAGRSILIQRNHGAVVTGPSVAIATARAVLLEAGARFQVLALSAGGSAAPAPVVSEARKRAHTDNLHLVWEAHLRRLRRTDPDVFQPVSATGWPGSAPGAGAP
jgi:L-fuculose-phosphate aldolase